MAKFSPIFLLVLLSLIYDNGVLVPIEATHHVYRNLQSLSSHSSDQPYRTAYHFQPPKNWINGIFSTKKSYNLTCPSFLTLIFSWKYFISLTVFCFVFAIWHVMLKWTYCRSQWLVLHCWIPSFILLYIFYKSLQNTLFIKYQSIAKFT